MKKKVLIGLAILVALFLWSVVSIFPDWLWFESLGFFSVYKTMLLTKIGFGSAIWLFLLLIIYLNLYIAKRVTAGSGHTGFLEENGHIPQLGISIKTMNSLLLALILIASFIIATKGSLQWDIVLRHFFRQEFGESDPLFGKDIGFYIFSLPFYSFIRHGLVVLFVFAGLLTVITYFRDGAIQLTDGSGNEEGFILPRSKISIFPKVKKHLLFLGGIIVLLMAWGYYLKVYELLYSTQGAAFGASYTDVHVKIWGYRVLVFISAAFAVILYYNSFKPKTRMLLMSGGVWLAAIFLFSTIIPIFVQKFIVKPNELSKELPYIKYNIENTRKAYNLHRIMEVDFAAEDQLDPEDLKADDTTIQNIRIWDERPLLQTYRQIQAIRLYYDFNNVDVGRYVLGNKYRQVMLAARELVVDQLPSQANTWVNRHLKYTHGYGLALSPVNEVTPEGLPQLLIKDLPPVFDVDLKVERPEIYYGEKTTEYVLVKTKTEEFDYSKGEKNVYTIYEGKGGVLIDSFIKRALFAAEFKDPQILFTNYLTPESRIMYNRRIDRRLRVIAPFLDYDADPYLVVSEGRLYWMIDGYTTSDMYPYSQHSKGPFGKKLINYIRNSVKITVDAYNGEAVFYLIDENDPVARAYSKMFPELFRPFNKMPDDLKKHIRYPMDLFELQVGAYGIYHMEDPQVFYNQEDLWQVPDEIYGDKRQLMKPYYIIIKLPEEDREEFLLMIPFTPSKKDNMIGWLAARCDLSNYGNLLAFRLPKDKLIYGPMQIEARVDQQTEISREFSLWSQRGSSVIRGNLLVVPIGETFIYVEPVYLEARQEVQSSPSRDQSALKSKGERGSFLRPVKARISALPELKRVIVSFSNKLAMEENLETSLSKLMEGSILSDESAASLSDSSHASDIRSHISQALQHYNSAKEFIRGGDWASYGRELERMEDILKGINE